MTTIPIEEEYGYRYWIWETPDRFESAKDRFENAVSDEEFFCNEPKDLDLGGTWTQVEYEEFMSAANETGINGHLHESTDSYIFRVKLEEVQSESERGGIGIRDGLKIRCPIGHEGSSPSARTSKVPVA